MASFTAELPRSKTAPFWLFTLVCLAASSACIEPEVGGLCDPDARGVKDKVKPKAGTDNLVRDVGLDNCSQALCASVDGSRGFCTVLCETDLECASAGDGFKCAEIVEFGPLACRDYSPDTDCPRDIDPDTGAQGALKNPLRYCTASAAVIHTRDVDWGRAKK